MGLIEIQCLEPPVDNRISGPESPWLTKATLFDLCINVSCEIDIQTHYHAFNRTDLVEFLHNTQIVPHTNSDKRVFTSCS